MARKFTTRQISIIKFISEQKQKGNERISIDQISDELQKAGINPTRNSLVVSMNILVDRLTESGIYFQKVKRLGRGRRQEYLIKKGAQK